MDGLVKGLVALMVVSFLLAVALAIGIIIAIACGIYGLAYGFAWICRDVVVAHWNLRHNEWVMDIAKLWWGLIAPFLGGACVAFATLSLVSGYFPNEKGIITLAATIVFVGSYYVVLATTTPKHSNWTLFQLYERRKIFNERLDHNEQKTNHEISRVILETKVKRIKRKITS